MACGSTKGKPKMSLWQETSEGLELISRTPESGRWVLKWADAIPVLYWKHAQANMFSGPFLGALGITAEGTGEPGNLDQSSISQMEIVRDRVELTFTPVGWHETTVRFAWTPTGNDQFDLQLQAMTRSVGVLDGVELGVISSVLSVPEPPGKWLVATRDEAAALRSGDGRAAQWLASQVAFETDETVTGYAETRDWPPGMIQSKDKSVQFLDSAHPFDISRRYRSASGSTQHTWTLGYSMERGVILRSRFRGKLLLNNDSSGLKSLENWQSAFLAEPLPLDR